MTPLTLQSLPPVAARLCLEVERFCRGVLALPRGVSLVLGLSGGADSTALAVVLHALAPRLDLRLHGLSVDHGLRPEAEADAAQARYMAHSLGLPCRIRQADVRGLAAREGRGLEDAARRLRYALLEEERQACGADFIALGHHAGDLSEDVLLRLLRGAGWPALGGMPARDDARRLLRPLLHTDPAALRQLLRLCGLTWREDASNHDTRFLRNRLRHTVLPLLRAENPSLDRSLGSLWQLAQQDADYWRQQTDAALANCPWQESSAAAGRQVYLPPALLQPLHPAARLRLYLRAVRRLCGSADAAPDATPDGRAAGALAGLTDDAKADGSAPAHLHSGALPTMGQTFALTPPHPRTAAQTDGQARARTLLALDAALIQGRGQSLFQLPNGVSARIVKGGVRFCAPTPPEKPRQR